jgi:hypothetical protein
MQVLYILVLGYLKQIIISVYTPLISLIIKVNTLLLITSIKKPALI